MLESFVDVYPVRVINAAMHVRDGDDLVARLVHQPRADAADVARALDGHAGRRRRHLEFLDRFVDCEENPAPLLAPPEDRPVNGLPVTHRHVWRDA